MDYARLIKYFRMLHRIPLVKFAEELGVTKDAVIKWENGTNHPSELNLFSIRKMWKEYGFDPETIKEEDLAELLYLNK